jgi:hypothetical protein
MQRNLHLHVHYNHLDITTSHTLYTFISEGLRINLQHLNTEAHAPAQAQIRYFPNIIQIYRGAEKSVGTPT